MYSQYHCSQYGQEYGHNQYFQTNSLQVSLPEITGKDTDRVPGFMGRNTGEDPNIKVTLQDKELWESFSRVGTEMIITKTGRRMFPGVKIKIDGLNPEQQYCVVLDVQAVDEKRYKFSEGEWKVGGRAEPHHQRRFFIHPDSPNTGHHWTSNQVTAEITRVKSECSPLNLLVILKCINWFKWKRNLIPSDLLYYV